jgi:hypothetical protein
MDRKVLFAQPRRGLSATAGTMALIRALEFLRPKHQTHEGVDKRSIALQTWSEAQISPVILSSVREGLDGPRAQLAKIIRRGQAAKRLTSKLDANAVAHTMIALFYGSVLQKFWKPDIDNKVHFAVFEHFLRSLEISSGSSK